MADLDSRQLLGDSRCERGGRAFCRSRYWLPVPPYGTQAPGFDRYKVSAYECTSISDGARSFPIPDKWGTNVAKEALAADEAAFMSKGMVTVPFNSELINTSSKQSSSTVARASRPSSRPRVRLDARCKTLPPPALTQEHRHRADVAHLRPGQTNGFVPTMAPGGVRTPRSCCRQRRSVCRETSLRPGDRCREFGDAFEHGIKGNALNDHSLSLAVTAFSLAETALLLSNSLQERMYRAGDGRRVTIVSFDFGKGECHAER